MVAPMKVIAPATPLISADFETLIRADPRNHNSDDKNSGAWRARCLRRKTQSDGCRF